MNMIRNPYLLVSYLLWFPGKQASEDLYHPWSSKTGGTTFNQKADWAALAQQELKESLSSKQPRNGQAKNIIMFIGDGMGVAPVTAARWHKAQVLGQKAHETYLAWDRFPVVGHSKVGVFITWCFAINVPEDVAIVSIILPAM